MSQKTRGECLDCIHRHVCFLYRAIRTAIVGTALLNVDGHGAPGCMSDVFNALANACLEFEPKQALPEEPEV